VPADAAADVVAVVAVAAAAAAVDVVDAVASGSCIAEFAVDCWSVP